jgi:hypothetical protein
MPCFVEAAAVVAATAMMVLMVTEKQFIVQVDLMRVLLVLATRRRFFRHGSAALANHRLLRRIVFTLATPTTLENLKTHAYVCESSLFSRMCLFFYLCFNIDAKL